MAATVFDKPMFPGAKFIVSEITVTNTSGAYTRTVENDKITAHMSAARMEVEDAYVIRGKVTITCANGSYTISCPEVVGQTDIKIFFLKTVDDQQTVTSAEFDVLNNRITAIENTEINNSITIPVNGWTLDSETGEYVYEWSNSAVTTACSVDVEFLESENDIDIDSITFEKGTGKITFTVEYLPNYAVPVNIRITNARASDVVNLTGEDIATDVISGASNVDEALEAVQSKIVYEENMGASNSGFSGSYTITEPGLYIIMMNGQKMSGSNELKQKIMADDVILAAMVNSTTNDAPQMLCAAGIFTIGTVITMTTSTPVYTSGNDYKSMARIIKV